MRAAGRAIPDLVRMKVLLALPLVLLSAVSVGADARRMMGVEPPAPELTANAGAQR